MLRSQIMYTPLALTLLLVCTLGVVHSSKSNTVESHRMVSLQKRKELKDNMTKAMKEREEKFKVWLKELNETLRYNREAYIGGIIALAVSSPVLWILSIIFFCMGAGKQRVQQKNTMSASLLSQPEMPRTRRAAPITQEPVLKQTDSQAVPPTIVMNKSPFVPPPLKSRLSNSPCSPTYFKGKEVKSAAFLSGSDSSPTVTNLSSAPTVSPTVQNINIRSVPVGASAVPLLSNAPPRPNVSPLLNGCNRVGARSPPRLSKVLGKKQ